MAAAEEEAAAPQDTAEGEDLAEAAEDAAVEAAAGYSWPQLRFDHPPRRLYHFARQFRSTAGGGGENFLKGSKWSPDGSSFLTSSDDNSLRLFYLYSRSRLFSYASPRARVKQDAEVTAFVRVFWAGRRTRMARRSTSPTPPSEVKVCR
jgi:telomerase Cajal body protein 1